ncbi:MAG: hypothetical protein EXR71_07610 [Myxococcales bacterium]|nr:hypothetical protein [Myxococcales bacterium]
MHRNKLLILPLLLVLACDGGGTDTAGKDSADPADTSDTADTADTGTDTGTDTGNDTGDTADTDPPLPESGYFGPPVVLVLADDGSGGAEVHLIDPSTATATVVSGVVASPAATLGCAGQYAWVMSDSAIGISARMQAVARTLALDVGFGPQAVAYQAPNTWFGGTGSASVVAFDEAGAASASIDLVSLADGDGKPDVMGFVSGPTGVAAVLARVNRTSGTYEPSGVALLDFTGTGSIASSGFISGGNAGRDSVGTPDGVLMALEPHGGTGVTLEIFDTSTLASGGEVLDLTGATYVGMTTGDNDGTVWIATKASGVVTVTHHLADGSAVSTITTGTSGDLLAIAPPNLWSGEGTSVVPYEVTTGTVGTPIDIGSTIYAMAACLPPPMIPDTGEEPPP